MSSIYIYPKLDHNKLQSPNPYINNLEAALAKKYTIVNQKPNSNGILHMYQHFFKTDFYFINWIEYLPNQKFGKIQVLLFLILLILVKVFNKKIIWVLHNKYAHTKHGHTEGVSRLKRIIFELMIKRADLIITHSTSGVDFVQEQFPKQVYKARYFIHPTDEMYPIKSAQKQYDLLIWGTIHPYKGILEFLEYITQLPNKNDLKVLILGKCLDKRLKNYINKYTSENIIHYNEFLDFKEIAQYANQSRFILFTYNSDSVLSSGSLMDSICMGTPIIGPNRGAFKDLKTYSFIQTYEKYDDILSIIQKSDTNISSSIEEIEKFCRENNWNQFLGKVTQSIREVIDNSHL